MMDRSIVLRDHGMIKLLLMCKRGHVVAESGNLQGCFASMPWQLYERWLQITWKLGHLKARCILLIGWSLGKRFTATKSILSLGQNCGENIHHQTLSLHQSTTHRLGGHQKQGKSQLMNCQAKIWWMVQNFLEKERLLHVASVSRLDIIKGLVQEDHQLHQVEVQREQVEDKVQQVEVLRDQVQEKVLQVEV